MPTIDDAKSSVVFDQKGANPEITGVNPIEIDKTFRFTREISDIAPKPDTTSETWVIPTTMSRYHSMLSKEAKTTP